jgi:hypothetical protein
MKTLANVRELILALALFFNPLGYNELFAYIMGLTGSYWTTSYIFYALAGGLFATYLILKRKFPLKEEIKNIEVENNLKEDAYGQRGF